MLSLSSFAFKIQLTSGPLHRGAKLADFGLAAGPTDRTTHSHVGKAEEASNRITLVKMYQIIDITMGIVTIWNYSMPHLARLSIEWDHTGENVSNN